MAYTKEQIVETEEYTNPLGGIVVLRKAAQKGMLSRADAK